MFQAGLVICGTLR